CGEAIQARALVHADWLLLARVAHGRLVMWQRVTVHRSEATIMARPTATRDFAVTAHAPLSGLAAAPETVLARAIASAGVVARSLAILARLTLRCAIGWSTTGATAAALRFVLDRADVVDAVAEIVDLVVEELFRIAVWWQHGNGGYRLGLA